MKNLAADPEVSVMLGDFFKDIFVSHTITNAAKTLTTSILESEQFQTQVAEVAKDRIIKIYQDSEVQKATSEFMWTTFQQAVWGVKQSQMQPPESVTTTCD